MRGAAREMLVGVAPAREHARRPRLWAALEDACAVRFQAREPHSSEGLDALLAIGVAPPSSSVPVLATGGAGERPGVARALTLSHRPALARELRGARLTESCADAGREVHDSETVLAELAGKPCWTLTAPNRQRVACAPTELAAGEALRERLRPGRSLALLALAHFLRGLDPPPKPRPLHAAFVIDDPNLRRPHYGHIDYAELLRDARRHGYHVAIAMVPLDGRLAHRRAATLFREGATHLSLCVHGNDHDGAELGRPRTRAQAQALVAQALRRTAAFERLAGVAVDRVMVPPHERLSEPIALALHRCGFQAVTTTRPYPWVANTPERSWLARPSQAGPLAGWRAVEPIAGGLPLLLRADFHHPREDLVLRAFLGQPLILYGHHDLLAGGPQRLAAAAAEIDGLGEVRWRSLAQIAGACAPAPPCESALTVSTGPSGVRLRPLARRLASEGRDRLGALSLL